MWIYAVLKVTNSGSHWTVKLCIQIGWPQQKLLKFLFYSYNCTLASGAVFHSVCQVWFSSGPPEFFSFSYCAWLWNWPVEQSCILSVKFDVQWLTRPFHFGYCTWLWNWIIVQFSPLPFQGKWMWNISNWPNQTIKLQNYRVRAQGAAVPTLLSSVFFMKCAERCGLLIHKTKICTPM